MKQDLLEPTVVVLLPRCCEATGVTVEQVVPRFPGCMVAALSSSDEETAKYSAIWGRENPAPLLILRAEQGEHMCLAKEAVTTIARQKKAHSVGLIIADGPEVSSYREHNRKSWDEGLASLLIEEIPDLQVVEYSSSWRFTPPRIR